MINKIIIRSNLFSLFIFIFLAIFYIDLLDIINKKRFNNKEITQYLKIIKKTYPAYVKNIYNNNITKDSIDSIIQNYT